MYQLPGLNYIEISIKNKGAIVYTSTTSMASAPIGIPGATGTFASFEIENKALFLAATCAGAQLGDVFTICGRGYNACDMYNYTELVTIGDDLVCADGPGGTTLTQSEACIVKGLADVKIYRTCTQTFYPITDATADFTITEIPAGQTFDKITSVSINGAGQNCDASDLKYGYTVAGTTVTVKHTPGEPAAPCYVKIEFQVCATIADLIGC